MSTYLEYQYPFENWQRITPQNEGTLTYSISQQPGQCCNAIYDVYFRYFLRRCLRHEVVSGNSGISPIRVAGKIIHAGYAQNPQGTQRGVYIITEDCNGVQTYNGVYVTSSSQPVSTAACYTTNSFASNSRWWSLPASTFEILNIVTVAGASMCGDYTFKVFENGVEIFRRTDPNQPEIRLGNLGECPENTCAVDCGSYVCCYNSQGISVFNYLK